MSNKPPTHGKPAATAAAQAQAAAKPPTAARPAPATPPAPHKPPAAAKAPAPADSWSLEHFAVDSIGNLATGERYGWVELSIAFRDPATAAYPQLGLRVPVRYERDWTIERTREAAFAAACHALAQAHDLFTRHSLDQLQRLDAEREAARDETAEPPDTGAT